MTTPSRPPRARDLGVPFEGTPGPLNALTDVAGVEVGHVTLIEGQGPLRVVGWPVRTGVTGSSSRPRRAGAGLCRMVLAQRKWRDDRDRLDRRGRRARRAGAPHQHPQRRRGARRRGRLAGAASGTSAPSARRAGFCLSPPRHVDGRLNDINGSPRQAGARPGGALDVLPGECPVEKGTSAAARG